MKVLDIRKKLKKIFELQFIYSHFNMATLLIVVVVYKNTMKTFYF